MGDMTHRWPSGVAGRARPVLLGVLLASASGSLAVGEPRLSLLGQEGPETRSSAANTRAGLACQVEHVFLVSARGDLLHTFFRDKLHLPEVWKYGTQPQIPFASGAVSVGNIFLEAVTWKSPQPGRDPARGEALLGGIAFEPDGDVEAERCTAAGLKVHSMPILSPTTWVANNIYFDDLSTPQQHLLAFITVRNTTEWDAYKVRTELNRQLKATADGPGFLGAQEIVLRARDAKKAAALWTKVLGQPASPGTWPGKRSPRSEGLDPGPAIRLVTTTGREEDGAVELTLKVKQLKQTVEFLRKIDSLDESREGDPLLRLPGITGGVRIRLRE
jgi:hypothetical protein